MSRNKVYVIERESSGQWIPAECDPNYRRINWRKRDILAKYPKESIRVRKYYSELEEVGDAKP